MTNKKKPPGSDNEFGIEFGDVNGIKLYETLLMSQKNPKRKTGKKDK